MTVFQNFHLLLRFAYILLVLAVAFLSIGLPASTLDFNKRYIPMGSKKQVCFVRSDLGKRNAFGALSVKAGKSKFREYRKQEIRSKAMRRVYNRCLGMKLPKNPIQPPVTETPIWAPAPNPPIPMPPATPDSCVLEASAATFQITEGKSAAFELPLPSTTCGRSVSYIVLTSPEHGKLSVSGRAITFDSGRFLGPSSFLYKIEDGVKTSAPATVSFDVRPVGGGNYFSCTFPPSPSIIDQSLRIDSQLVQHRYSAFDPYETALRVNDVSDPQNPISLIAPNGCPTVFRNVPDTGSNGGFLDGLTADSRPLSAKTTLIPNQNGFDLVVEYQNHSATESLPLGTISIPGLRFRQNIGQTIHRIDWYNLNYNQEGWATYEHNISTGGFLHELKTWPSHPPLQPFSSPVRVLKADGYYYGASIQYPMLEYGHSVGMQLGMPGGLYNSTGSNWHIEFQLLNASVAPGERKSYTVSFRMMRESSVRPNSNDWLRVVTPYRDYFHRTYGAALRYVPDKRPIGAMEAASVGDISLPNNSHGFICYGGICPHIAGWEAYQNIYQYYRDRGYMRTMLWVPSGLFNVHRDLNYPFQFTTGMPNFSNAVTTFNQIAPSQSIGLWWGNTAILMNGWDSGVTAPFDPFLSSHATRGFEEFDKALELGAKEIGLDAYIYLPGRGIPWIEMMRERAGAPIRFTEEGISADIDSLYIASWVDNYVRRTPKIFGDFLAPHRDVVSGVRLDPAQWGRLLSLTEKQAEVELALNNGFIPNIWEVDSIPAPTRLPRLTYFSTVPDDLRPLNCQTH